jgi:hypothetical protein
MQVISKMVYMMGTVYLFIEMVINMKVNSKMVNFMAKVNCLINLQVKLLQVHGKMMFLLVKTQTKILFFHLKN